VNAGTFVPKNFRPQDIFARSKIQSNVADRKFQGTKDPWNESSMELSSPGTKVRGDESSL